MTGMGVRLTQKFEPVKVSRVRIAPAGIDRATVKVSDQWREPARPKAQVPDLSLDNDIPF
jgi:hypothetical protein